MSTAFDLTLAVNYIPAVLCLARVFGFTLAICLINPGAEIGGLTLVALTVYLDRAIARFYAQHTIFDSNGVIACVFFANVFLFLRSGSTEYRISFGNVVVNLWWIVAALFMLVEPARVTRTFERRHRVVYHLIPAFVTVATLAVLSTMHADREPAGIVLSRAMAFSLLSIAWVYIVGTKKCQPPETLRDASTGNVVARFSPVLCAHPGLAAIFAAAAAGCLVYQYVVLYRGEPDLEAPEPPPPKNVPSVVVEPDVEEAFRLARARAGPGS